jgi:hypothetical protein
MSDEDLLPITHLLPITRRGVKGNLPNANFGQSLAYSTADLQYML